MFGKKKIEAVSVLDLRNYTPQALRKISSIQAVSTILLPENLRRPSQRPMRI